MELDLGSVDQLFVRFTSEDEEMGPITNFLFLLKKKSLCGEGGWGWGWCSFGLRVWSLEFGCRTHTGLFSWLVSCPLESVGWVNEQATFMYVFSFFFLSFLQR